jgi:hypothetical protein
LIFYIKQLQNITADNAPATIIGTVTKLLGMDTKFLEQFFNFKPVERMTFGDFASTISMLYPYISGILQGEQADQLGLLVSIANSVKQNNELFPEDISEMFSSMEGAEMFNEDAITLLYILSRSNTMDFSQKSISQASLFHRCNL